MRARIYKVFAGILIAVYILWMALPETASATPPQTGSGNSPFAQYEPKRGINPETGNVSFIGAEDPINVPGISDVNGLTVQDRAMAMANVYGKEFGLANPSQELKLIQSKKDENGKDIVHYQQAYKGAGHCRRDDRQYER
jgi:hypothetical protein